MPAAKIEGESNTSEDSKPISNNGISKESNESKSGGSGNKTSRTSEREIDESNNSLSSSNNTRAGRASGSSGVAKQSNKVSGYQTSEDENDELPFQSNRYGVLGSKDNQQRFELIDQANDTNQLSNSAYEKYSLGVDTSTRIDPNIGVKSGLRTSISIGQDGGTFRQNPYGLKEHVYDVAKNAGLSLIENAIAGGTMGTLSGAAGGGLPGAVYGGSIGLIGGAAKGLIVGPIQSCVQGCHVFDVENKSTSDIVDRIRSAGTSVKDSIHEMLGFSKDQK